MKDDNLFAGMNSKADLFEDDYADEVDVIDQLLDPDNDDPIIIYDEDNNPVRFDQVAIIPHIERLFVILKPIEEMEGVADDEAIVFEVVEDDKGAVILEIVDDDEIAIAVFDIYYQMLDEE